MATPVILRRQPSGISNFTRGGDHGSPPVHASWLNQGELLNHAFSFRYLKRTSWSSREALIAHVEAAWPGYNRLYAHPFQWSWTNQRMRKWFAQHAVDND